MQKCMFKGSLAIPKLRYLEKYFYDTYHNGSGNSMKFIIGF